MAQIAHASRTTKQAMLFLLQKGLESSLSWCAFSWQSPVCPSQILHSSCHPYPYSHLHYTSSQADLMSLLVAAFRPPSCGDIITWNFILGQTPPVHYLSLIMVVLMRVAEIDELMSPTYSIPIRKHSAIWKHIFSQGTIANNSPAITLMDGIEPGQCWAFQGDSGQLGIWLVSRTGTRLRDNRK